MRHLAPFIVAVLAWSPSVSRPAAAPAESTLWDSSKVRSAFMSRAVSARPVGMGEAFTAVADDASAVSWNPAGMAAIDAISAVAMYDSAGDSSVSYAAAAMPAGPVTAGVALSVFDQGEYDVRDNVGLRTGTESLLGFALGVGAGRGPIEFLNNGSAGAGIELVQDPVDGAVAFGLNAGVLVPAWAGSKLGMAILHLGPAKDGFSLPAVVRLGGSWAGNEVMRVAVEAGYGIVDGEIAFSAGTELTPYRPITLRLGYKRILEDQGIDGLGGLTVGAGFRYSSVCIDYAYQPFGDIVTSHRVALVYSPKPLNQ